jgi:Ca2+-binding EF-hand superfamily protein
VAALPATVKLEATDDRSIQEQLLDAMKKNAVKLIDLFRDWDDDGNGAIDKKEMRQAVAALGFEAPRKEVDAFFDSIDKDSSGFIEYEEFKKALSDKGAAKATEERRKTIAAEKRKSEAKAAAEAKKAATTAGEGDDVDDTDVAGEGEEDFETGMRQNLMERDVADADQDGKLDFTEFCQFVRDREEGEFTDEYLKTRFDALDADASGKIDMAEYLQWSLKDSLARSSQRVVDLFRIWDEDKSGTVDKKEFHKAINALGFEMERYITDAVFESLDDDKSGNLEYKELNEMLRKGVGAEAAKNNLKRAKMVDRSRGAKYVARRSNSRRAMPVHTLRLCCCSVAAAVVLLLSSHH